MDINSLLSPQDAPPRNPTPTSHPMSSVPKKRGRPASGKRTSSALSQEITISPEPPEPPRSVPQLGHEAVAHAQQQFNQTSAFSPSYNGFGNVRTPLSNIDSPGSEMRSPFGTPQHYRTSALANHRPSPTPQMEALADIASMQQPSQPRQSVAHLQAADPHTMQHSPISRAMAPPISRNISAMSSTDLVMAEAPAQTPPPRNFTSTSLSDIDLQSITDLASYLADHTYDYNTHVQLINLLHQGFVSHVQDSSTDTNAAPDPKEYSLLSDLRQAREAMDSRFAVGESIWKDWIQDEKLLAKSSEERQAVVELCTKAVQEEPSSIDLWLLYGDWMWSTYAQANGILEADPNVWTEEDKMICQELFTRDMVISVWNQAQAATKWRIDASHITWNRYIEIIMQDFPENPPQHAVDEVQTLYMMRLQVPHQESAATAQSFWPFISKYSSQGWEEIMSATNDMAAAGKREIALREVNEHALARATESGDQTALYNVFVEYLAAEARRRKKGQYDLELRSSLFDRALLAFPSLSEWWLDYADFLVMAKAPGPLILAVLERATRHCPWSGESWHRRLLRAELEDQPYNDIENIKHKATNSGLLEHGGMEEYLKVLTAWATYLRRRAFRLNSTDDDIDMADMGIAGVLEDVHVAGKKTYGDEFTGDPLWRIEKIHIKFLSQANRVKETREFWRSLIPAQKNNYDFWYRYYNWEIFIWGSERMKDIKRIEKPDTTPTLATQVLREALAHKTLDWPEKLLEIYSGHFDMHELPATAEKAITDLRKVERQIKERRAKEAEVAAHAAEQAPAAEDPTATEDVVIAGKRKRDEEALSNGDAVKRNKIEQTTGNPAHESSASASAQAKRDREHNTITIKNLPADVTELRLRKFFADCGKVLSVSMINDSDAMTTTATIEFESHEDVLSARTRDGKEIDGQVIHIQSGSQSTLYVANYPEDYDEVKIRELFKDFGTIISVRLPSLKFNNRRRFCYVQFLTADEARAATTVDQKVLDKQHRLLAKISDPDAKKTRSGATAEGREIIVKNVDFTVIESEIRDFFGQSGKVENIRMLRNASGRFIGTAFVVYSSTEEANAALVLNNKPLKDRLLRVELASDKSSRDAANQKLSSITVVGGAKSASPAPGSTAGSPPAEDSTGRRASITSDKTAAASVSGEPTYKTKFERTIALLNVPDTVNNARVQSFLEQYGPIHKIVMRRDQEGALVEFVNLADAGKVGMGIDCSTLGTDTKVGTYAELNGRKPKAAKTGGAAAMTARAASKPNSTIMRPAQTGVSRPTQKVGRRGGLGFKRGGFGASSSKSSSKPEGDGAEAKSDTSGVNEATKGSADS